MEEKLIMGLDVSTSTIGIALFKVDGKLVELNHISPIIKNFDGEKHDELYQKAYNSVEYILEKYNPEIIGEIIIETPLISSEQKDTAALLNYFGGIFFGLLKSTYPTAKCCYITVDEARRYGLPEILGGKKKVLFGAIEKKIDGVEIKDFKKMVVLSVVSQKFPDVVWLLNNNMTIDKKNFDRADSIVVVLGYKQKNGEWIANSKDIEKTRNFLKSNVEYEKFLKGLDGKKPDEKNRLKFEYLKNTFKIQQFINIAI